MPAPILAEIGGGALVAFVGRRPVIKGEGAGDRARAVVMQVADRVRERRGPVVAVVMAGFGEGRGDSDGRKQGTSCEKLHFPHHNSPEFHAKTGPFFARSGLILRGLAQKVRKNGHASDFSALFRYLTNS